MYNQQFYDRNLKYASDLSERLTPFLCGVLKVNSIVDFGCGEGKLLSDLSYGFPTEDILGLNYNKPENLCFPEEKFMQCDFTKDLSLDRKFDLAISLEVAEHIDKQYANHFIDLITSHSSGLILFSAAVPGQGGVHHVNEQPHEYWHEKFYLKGYRCFDIVRPYLRFFKTVPSWYRNNIFIYGTEESTLFHPKPQPA